MDTVASYARLKDLMRETALLGSVKSLLVWDMQTVMPPRGQSLRVDQTSLIDDEIHTRLANPEVGALLADLEMEAGRAPDPEMAANVRHWRRAHDRASRIPRELKTALSRASTTGRHVWEQARIDNDWSLFAPHLEELARLKGEEASAVGYANEPYDALLDEFEPGMTARAIEPIFARLARELPPLVREAANRQGEAPDALAVRLSRKRIRTFVRLLASGLGYDFKAGRLDEAAHPFSMEIGPGDVRITTRFDPGKPAFAIFGTIHETGHALYSLGLPQDHWYEPVGQALSIGIHESQSRLWENFVGKSEGFWTHFHPLLLETIPQLQGLGLGELLRSINAVRPGEIRVEADEATYNLHVILRFEIEAALFRGELAVKDIPGLWGERMREGLGVEPASDARGALQDVHWSMGYFGYFPTYALGNLYAAQLFHAAGRAFPDMSARFARGDFAFLLSWLRENVHAQGARFDGGDLIERVTGSQPNPDFFLTYLKEKYLEDKPWA